MKPVILGFRFLLELAILASFWIWASALPLQVPERLLLGMAICLTAAILWGLVLSPKRRWDLPSWARLFIEAIFFLAASAALFAIGYSTWALALALAGLGHRIALAALD